MECDTEQTSCRKPGPVSSVVATLPPGFSFEWTDLSYQERLLRFIENHDEPRVAAAFPPPKARAAAVIMATIPGAKLFHEGQFEGRKVKVPTFLGRRPEEPVDVECQGFYEKLLAIIHAPVVRDVRRIH